MLVAATSEGPRRPPLEDLALEDDGGGDTQDRYAWQHHCTAVDALRMLTDDSIKRVVCEVEEDYLIEFSDGRLELVSCKHREPGQGEWKLFDLCKSGGVGHLFATWHKLRPYRLRLLTSAGLRTGANEAHDVAEACAHLADGGAVEDVEPACRALAAALLAARRLKAFEGIPETPRPQRKGDEVIPEEFLAAVVEFMAVLVVRPGLAHRALIRDHTVEAVVRPLLAELGLTDAQAGDQYEAVLSKVAEKNHTDGLTGRIAEWMSGVAPEGMRGSDRALINARSIFPDDMRLCVHMTGVRPLLRRFEATGHERLQTKLIEGGVGATRINSALRLREAWLAAWAELRTGLPGDLAALEDLEAQVLDVAGDSEAAVSTTTGEWGNAMYVDLKTSLEHQAASLGSAMRLAPKLLFGVALDLAAQCEIWFSEPFDVDAALAALAQDEGGVT